MPDLTLDKLHLFLLIVLPGFVAIKVYDLIFPPEKRDFGSSLLEVIVYGIINFGIWTWPLLELNQRDFIERRPALYAVCSFGFLVLSPAILAAVTAMIRSWKFVARRIGYPTKTAWDDYFGRCSDCYILFHLKNGKMLGGYFGASSYATSFPNPQEIYVQEVWRVDDYGEFIEKVPGTLGAVLRPSEFERMEFRAVERNKTDGKKQ